jgi:hypothetical protein
MEQASAARELFLRSAGIGRSLLDNIIEAYGTPAFTADIARLASHVPASTDRKAEPIPYPQTASTLARLYLCIAKIYILEDIGYNRELQSKARRAGHRVDNTCNLRYQRIYGGGILREMVEIEVDVLCRLESTVCIYFTMLLALALCCRSGSSNACVEAANQVCGPCGRLEGTA